MLISVREAILWCCSHALYIDAELKQQYENLAHRPICYKDYLRLWISILECDNYEISFRQYLINVYLSILKEFIDNLNLNIKTSDMIVLADVSAYFKAENKTDFHLFFNLVDLSVEILSEIEKLLLQGQVEKFILLFIKHSYNHPMISGFYKLTQVFLTKLPEIQSDCFKTINQYLLNVANLANKFSGELQLSCIYLILSTPIIFARNMLRETLPVFETAFHSGLTDFKLAFAALDALEKWTQETDGRKNTDFYECIINCLEPYLQVKKLKIITIEIFVWYYPREYTCNSFYIKIQVFIYKLICFETQLCRIYMRKIVTF